MNLMHSDLGSREMGGLGEVVLALLGGSPSGAVEPDPFTLVATGTRSLVSYYFCPVLIFLSSLKCSTQNWRLGNVFTGIK